MTLLCLFIVNFSCNTVSIPISSYTLSNPAFTGLFGDYELSVEQRDIGEITFFNFCANIRNWAFGFSNAYHETEYVVDKRSWLSMAYHFSIPISFGLNAGAHRRWNETSAYVDVGASCSYLLDLGISYQNVLDDEQLPQILRAGVSYRWYQFVATFEVEDSVRQEKLIPHIILTANIPMQDFNIAVYCGYRHTTTADFEDRLAAGIGVSYRSMIHSTFLYDEYAKLAMGFNIKPRVQVHHIQHTDTIVVHKPVIVEKTTYREVKPETRETPVLTNAQKEYCEEHYLRGIEYFVKDKLSEAIAEWKLVVNVHPDYKDVQRYLENARAKLELLEE